MEATRVTLPYFAPADSLPAPLPTVADVKAAREAKAAAEKDGTEYKPIFPSRLIRVGEHYIVKHGKPHEVRLQEGENMMFVRQASGGKVAVPTVYALFHDEESGENFIIQEYVRGQTVTRLWKEADHEGRLTMARALRQAIGELRRIPSPGYFGGLWRQPILALPPGGSATPQTLFPEACETPEQWVDAFLQTRPALRPGRTHFNSDLLRFALEDVFSGQRPVFTHADLDSSNVIVRDGDEAAVLVDWESSGWYPECWEFCCANPVSTTVLPGTYHEWRLWLRCVVLDSYYPQLGWVALHRNGGVLSNW